MLEGSPELRGQFLPRVLDSLFDGVVVTDTAGHILYINEPMKRIAGWSRAEAHRRLVWEVFLAPAQWAADQNRLPERAAGKSEVYDLEARHRDGRRLVWRVRATPLLDGSRRFVGTIGVVSDVTDERRLTRDNALLREEIAAEINLGHIVGSSPAVHKVIEQIKVVAPTDATVLILGESGTGKELIARAIHEQSQHRAGPLVRVNCAAVPRELFESEFFGHVRGAFTGALKDRSGRFELADGGTLFLDEVGEIPYDLQGKLLRVLQEGAFERVGEDQTRKVDVRVVAATNQELFALTKTRQFRADLYYRLSVFPVSSPPLRERVEDVPILARFFLQRFAQKLNLRQTPRLTKVQERELSAYPWPGNVRELENTVERALILAAVRGGKLEFDLPSDATILPSRQGLAPELGELEVGQKPPVLKELEYQTVLSVLKATQWRIHGPQGAAARLGLNAFTLTSRLKRLGLARGSDAHRAFLRGT
ncbi:MAG: sigma 54-interacting transcriptional regulator [Rhodospirillales bacterium]|nr:sigma 54-interacting transcriptional regulator [Acetobacter sp.]